MSPFHSPIKTGKILFGKSGSFKPFRTANVKTHTVLSNTQILYKMKRFQTLRQAKKFFKEETGVDYDKTLHQHSGMQIFLRKNKKLKYRYLVGTYIDWLNYY